MAPPGMCRSVDDRSTQRRSAPSAEYRRATCTAVMTPDDDVRIRFAIEQRRLVQFSLQGGIRVAEPHDYGIRDGVAQLLAYQVRGASQSGRLPNWRWVILSRASGFVVLDETFAGGRGAPSGKHSTWEKLFARVAPAGRR
jgi:hypothetical protein